MAKSSIARLPSKIYDNIFKKFWEKVTIDEIEQLEKFKLQSFFY